MQIIFVLILYNHFHHTMFRDSTFTTQRLEEHYSDFYIFLKNYK